MASYVWFMLIVMIILFIIFAVLYLVMELFHYHNLSITKADESTRTRHQMGFIILTGMIIMMTITGLNAFISKLT